MKNRYRVILLFSTMILLAGCSFEKKDNKDRQASQDTVWHIEMSGKNNTYDTLNVATYLTRINQVYFLNDCYHDQILYQTELNPDLHTWKVLTSEAHYPHTIAGDDKVLLMDDTENNRVLVYQYENGGFKQSQILDNIGLKPHFVQYEPKRETFYVWSSITGELYHMKRNKETDEVYISEIKKIEELFGVYVRSFTIIGDDIYFVSGHNNQKIIKVNLDTFDIIEEYKVTPQIAGMVQLLQIEDYFYLTISTDSEENQEYATIIRTKDLHSLERGEYEDVYDQFATDKGTPYFITKIDETYYMSHHRTTQNIISFEVNNNEIENVKVIY